MSAFCAKLTLEQIVTRIMKRAAMNATPMKPIILNLLQQSRSDEAAWEQELTEAERTAIGTPQLWSAKDHVEHQTFCHQDLIQRLTAIRQHQEVEPREKSDDEEIAVVFAEHRLLPWFEAHEESERVYADLIMQLEHLSEGELNDTEHFTAIVDGGRPCYAAFLSNCYEHDQEHLGQYYSDRNDLPQAMAIRERCVDRVLQVEVPAWVKGGFLYNLACYYAQQNHLEDAATRLQAAVTYHSRLKEHAESDPELAALRAPSV